MCAPLWNLVSMRAHQLAIHGHGMLPGLLALHLLARASLTNLVLLTSDQAIGGDQLEPVIAARLSTASRALVEPFVVARWADYLITHNGQSELHDDEVLLLDPVQVWLELQDLIEPAALIADCGALSEAGGTLTWQGGQARIEQLIDLDPLLGPPCASEIVGLEALRWLGHPVLADYDAADAQWAAHQYLPLGDERAVIRKLPRQTDLLQAHSTFETLLNGLTAT